MAHITERFRSDIHFTQMMSGIGLAPTERNRFTINGFTNTEVVSFRYKLNVKGFKT